MLTKPTLTAFLPTVDSERSKRFYLDILGLKLVSEDDYALEFQNDGAILRATVVAKFTPQSFTTLGFKIKNVVNQVKTLSKKGVKFEKYSSLDQDDLGIWQSPSMAKIAWFKDPDGNLLSLTEHAD